MKTSPLVLLAALLLAPALSGRAQGAKVDPPAPASPVTPDFPVTDATVSLLEPAGAQCEWLKVEPLSSKRRVLATLAAGCQGGSTALSRDGKRGAVRFWRGAVSMPITGRPTFPDPFPSQAFRDRLFLVELATGTVEELPLPPEGELIEYGFDPGGRLLGLCLEGAGPAQEEAHTVELDGAGRQLEAGRRAAPMKAHAFAFLGGKWLRMESKDSRDGLGTAALELRKDLGERSIRALDPRFKGREFEDDALLDSLYELSPEQPEGQWSELRIGTYSLAIWGTPFGADMLATGLIRRLDRGRALVLPAYPYRPNEMISLRTRGPYLLVSLADSGAHPRLYRGQKLVWSSESARAVTLWPSEVVRLGAA